MSAREIGSVLDGKYEIVERLAAGGMGEVFRVRHVHLHEMRVIKILRQDRAADPSAIQRFSQEARIATQIKHANVAILYDFSRLPDGSFYMVWEHIQGEDVSSWLREKGPFPLQLAVELGIQGLRGLEAIHSAGVIHRDLSPDNLMITRDLKGRHQVKIIDLGLAKNLATPASNLEITQAGMFMGKLMYCSPEQAGGLKEGTAIDHRSDLYSFGAVLYEMIAGLPPFDSENQHGFVFKRLTEEALPLTTRNPRVRVPEELDRAVRKALERDRDSRYPDAVAFLQALVRVADQLRQVATQELPVPAEAGGGQRGATSRASSAPVPLAAAAGPVVAAPVRRQSTTDLTREERLELLAQIDRAANSARLLERAEHALAAGKLDEAKALAKRLEAVNAKNQGLADLRRRIAEIDQGAQRGAREREMAERLAAIDAALAGGRVDEADDLLGAAVGAFGELPGLVAARERLTVAREASERQERLREAEALVEKYIKDRKQALAELALDTLLEIAPDHPKRQDYQTWVRMIGGEVEKLKQAERILATGREQIGAGDFRAARRQLEAIEKSDPSGELAGLLAREIEEAEARVRQESDLARRRERMESLLAARQLEAAEQELGELAGLGLPRVAAATYRARLDEIRLQQAGEQQATALEERFREAIGRQDWFAAREIVEEYARTVPVSQRPGAMLSEIGRLEDLQRRRQGVEQGARQLDNLLDSRRLGEAELTLKVLLGLDPHLPRRAEFEARIAQLRRGG